MPTWDSAAGRRSVDGGLWKGPLAGDDGNPGAGHSPRFRRQAVGVPHAASKRLVEYARERLSRQLAAPGASPEAMEEAKHLFDPDALTLGFARRFATYKRPNLLLQDPERLLRLLPTAAPVQLVIAGKAHPGGPGGPGLDPGMDALHPPARGLSACDLPQRLRHALTEHLVQGVDVWINTPRRPWEASGTSGMKVLVNGGINLSELDGWWAEATRRKWDGRWGTDGAGDDPAGTRSKPTRSTTCSSGR